MVRFDEILFNLFFRYLIANIPISVVIPCVGAFIDFLFGKFGYGMIHKS